MTISTSEAALVFLIVTTVPVFSCSSKSNKNDPSTSENNENDERSSLFVSEDHTEWGAGDAEVQYKDECEVPVLPNVGYSFR